MEARREANFCERRHTDFLTGFFYRRQTPWASATVRHVRAPACPEAESPLPRYFFHVQDGENLRDTEGTELPNRQAVRTEALRTSGELIRGQKVGADFWLGAEWSLEVEDGRGRPVLTLWFAGAEHGAA
jgi:hypothetical protein